MYSTNIYVHVTLVFVFLWIFWYLIIDALHIIFTLSSEGVDLDADLEIQSEEEEMLEYI